MNTKLNHSRAPWRVSGQPCYAGFKVVDATDRSVAAFPSNSTRPEEERAANAALIAAAPDLLEALRFSQMVMLGYSPRNEMIQNALDKTAAAIAKATGGQS